MPFQGTPDPASLRRVLDTVFAAPVYRWAEEPVLLRALREWWERLGDWLSSLRADNPMFFRALVIALLLALLFFLGHAAWVVWRTVQVGGGSDAEHPATPGADTRDASWYYREADLAASEGRTHEALQLAFIGLALTLESQGLLRYHPSKTPAECAREANLAGSDRDRLREMVRTLYASVFGGGRCTPDDYRRWRASGAQTWNAAAR